MAGLDHIRIRQNDYGTILYIAGPMRKRELKRAIVRIVWDREVYGYELRGLLAAGGTTVQLSYLYTLLKEMTQDGLLESRVASGDRGPAKRMYRLAPKGRRELGHVFGEATELIHEAYEDYVSRLPRHAFADRFHEMMGHVYGKRASVAFVISEPLTHLHRDLLETLCSRPTGKRTYLVKPPGMRVDIIHPGLTVLDGTFDDIPLKDASLDGMIVVDIQDAHNMKRCCAEFRRVLRDGGVMCACAPFLGLTGEGEPIELGEFMKKMKQDLRGQPYRDKESVRKALAQHFDYVDVTGMGFMTAFLTGLRPIEP